MQWKFELLMKPSSVPLTEVLSDETAFEALLDAGLTLNVQ